MHHNLKIQCYKTLDFPHHLSGKSWVTDRRSLLRLYTVLLLFKLFYGSVVYGQSFKTLLRTLDFVHNACLWIATPNDHHLCFVPILGGFSNDCIIIDFLLRLSIIVLPTCVFLCREYCTLMRVVTPLGYIWLL